MIAEGDAFKIRDLRNTSGFAVLMQYWNAQRELIISEGKASRSEEKTIRTWARLAGFDEAVGIIAKLAKIEEKHDNDPELED